MDAWLKFALEAPWSASLVVLVAAVLGAMIGGWFSIQASRLAMRDSLKAQLDLQQREGNGATPKQTRSAPIASNAKVTNAPRAIRPRSAP